MLQLNLWPSKGHFPPPYGDRVTVVVSRISPVQSVVSVRKATLNKPFIFSILGLGRAHNVLTHNAPSCHWPSFTHDCTGRVNKAYQTERLCFFRHPWKGSSLGATASKNGLDTVSVYKLSSLILQNGIDWRLTENTIYRVGCKNFTALSGKSVNNPSTPASK